MSIKAGVKELRIAHPDWTQVQMAEALGVWKQAVQKTLASMGLPTKRGTPYEERICLRDGCGQDTRLTSYNRHYNRVEGYCCRRCRQSVLGPVCPGCGRVIDGYRRRKYATSWCSDACYKAAGTPGAGRPRKVDDELVARLRAEHPAMINREMAALVGYSVRALEDAQRRLGIHRARGYPSYAPRLKERTDVV